MAAGSPEPQGMVPTKPLVTVVPALKVIYPNCTINTEYILWHIKLIVKGNSVLVTQNTFIDLQFYFIPISIDNEIDMKIHLSACNKQV